MDGDFVTYVQAVRLKELGFNWKTHAFYTKDGDLYTSDNPDYWNNEIWAEFSAPNLAQVRKWLREEKHIVISVRPNDTINDSGNDEIYYSVDVFDITGNILKLQYSDAGIENYESALEDGVDEAIELLKQQNNGK